MLFRRLVRAFSRRPRSPERYRPQLEGLEERWMPSAAQPLPPPPSQPLTVMSRNLYLGADLDPVAAAVATGDPNQIIGAVSTAWQNMVANNFPERAEALADAEEALKIDTRAPNLYQVACIYALTSKDHPEDRDEAYRLLWRALRTGFGLDWVDTDTDLDPLRSDPKFKNLVAGARNFVEASKR